MRELSEDEMLHGREPELQMARAAALMRRLRQPDFHVSGQIRFRLRLAKL